MEDTAPSLLNKSPFKFESLKLEANKFVVEELSKIEFVAFKILEKKFVVVAKFANKPPVLFIENIELLFESKISKIFAFCPSEASNVMAVELEDVDCTVTTEFETEDVVPKDDWPVPLTCPDTSAKAEEVIFWRGERVSKEELFGETSTCKYNFLFVLKL